MNDKPTKEKMLELLKLLESRHEFSQEGKEILDAILRLIEHGTEVSRGFVVNSARAMHVEPDALRICLEEAGVAIKAKK